MTRRTFVSSVSLLFVTAVSASAQTADISVSFPDMAIGTKSMYITTMSAFADETWYFGMCENQYAQPDVRISITPFSAFADFEVYAASSPNFADRVVCVIGDVPKELVEALK